MEKVDLESISQKAKEFPQIIREIINTLQTEFPEGSFSIQQGRKIGQAIFLSVRLKENNKKILQERLKELATQFDLEIEPFDGNTNYIVHQRRFNGRVNWRRWLHYPDAISSEAAAIIDRIVESAKDLSEDVETRRAFDNYEKYCNLIDAACEAGIITKDEKLLVKGQSHVVSWGY